MRLCSSRVFVYIYALLNHLSFDLKITWTRFFTLLTVTFVFVVRKQPLLYLQRSCNDNSLDTNPRLTYKETETPFSNLKWWLSLIALPHCSRDWLINWFHFSFGESTRDFAIPVTRAPESIKWLPVLETFFFLRSQTEQSSFSFHKCDRKQLAMTNVTISVSKR